jgi:hypothetical protein
MTIGLRVSAYELQCDPAEDSDLIPAMFRILSFGSSRFASRRRIWANRRGFRKQTTCPRPVRSAWNTTESRPKAPFLRLATAAERSTEIVARKHGWRSSHLNPCAPQLCKFTTQVSR